MQMTFRWFGSSDPVPLAYIRQIPGVHGVVSALYDVPVGEVWTLERIAALADEIGRAGLRLAVIESIPVHEDVKRGLPTRERWIENYCRSVEHMGELGIPVLCYNFMPVFDWTRTSLDWALPDGSTALAYDHEQLGRIDLSRGTGDLPGWATAYSAEELDALLTAYRQIDEEQLWENLGYFLERVAPVAEAAGVKMAIHPDDPPWSIFGLPRVVTSGAAFQRVTELVDVPANGVTFCTGSLGANPDNDLPAAARTLAGRGRIHFAHCRNVAVTGERQFHEAPHLAGAGSVQMLEVLQALQENGFDGPMRPDHGRMIWGEKGRPGYGLYDRALGAMYLQGVWDALERGETLRRRPESDLAVV
jgi:mannonate dehydratase